MVCKPGTESGNQDFRGRLLEGMAAAVRERGFRDATVADVVRHAHTSRRTFYEYFPDKQAWVDWLGTQISGRELQEVAATRQSTGPSWLVRPLQKLPQGVVSATPGFFGFGAGNAIGQSSGQPPKAYVSETFLDAKVDHLCLQFAHHAEFVPVYRTGDGGSFAVASYPASDQPTQMIGYDTAGQVVGTKALGEQTGAE